MFDTQMKTMKYAIAALVICTLSVSCNSANNQRPSTKYEEKKASMADMEKESPLKFLKISGSHRRNLVSQEVIEGEVANHATLTSYKNIEIQLTFLNSDGSTVDKQKHTLDDVAKPGSSVDFKIKVSHVKDASSVTMDIVDAVADK